MPRDQTIDSLLSFAARAMPFSGAIKRRIRQQVGQQVMSERVLKDLPAFVPNSRGSQGLLADLTWQSVRSTFPLLNLLLRRDRPAVFEEVTAQAFCAERHAEAEALAALLNRYGSDKANFHSYHYVYAKVFADLPRVSRLLEIGLGTPNTAIASHMGVEGRPGASLRAFRDYLPGAEIHGADVDRAILFREERIATVFVDQTDLASFAELRAIAGAQGFDVIIDDGLHSPGANLAVLLFALDALSAHGVLVIEDIKEDALPVWHVVRALLWEACETALIRDAADYLLVLRPRR
ncbi:hypothetical protein [Elioraea sp.]|uniref:hypothetical protein n=1 Tax=Elioraea sp. TaxID=2185103 RepID=UPI003F6F2643